jgi:Tfp pilus assembly protein PilZ
MENHDKAEGRRCQRLSIELPATIEAIDGQGGFCVATTVDLSVLGFRIFTDAELKTSQEVAMKISIDGQMLNLRVKVAWATPTEVPGEKKYLVGVKILETPSQDELKFVKYFARELLEFSKK